MQLLTVELSAALFTIIIIFCIGIAFVAGCIWMASGRSSKEEEAEYWRKMHPVGGDDPEGEQLKEGETPIWRKAK